MHAVNIDCLGYSLAADWYEGESTSEIILFLMGYTSSKKQQEDMVAAITKNTGRSTLVIDYSGHGESPFELKDIRPAQHLIEVVTAYDWIRSRYPDTNISVSGGSYGGFLATHLINYRKVKQLVLRAPAIYRPEQFYDTWGARLANEHGYGIVSRAYRTDADALKDHPILKSAGNFAGKTLVVVHSDDKIVPKETTNAYAEAFNAEVYTADGFGHAISQSDLSEEQLAEYYSRISSWLNKV